jgi:excinuclease ABC subunit C
MQLPMQPGVYLMHDKDGNVIYVGKAKLLKNRVSQYFGSDRNHDEKVIKMVSHVDWFETIVTDSEFEALVLECSLIKQYNPKYNILLKDDKGYHYIKITPPPWSRIVAAKSSDVQKDGATYLGPFLSGWVVNQAVDEVTKIFQIPTCSRRFPQEIGKSRPCLNFYIKQCCAPCRGKISEQQYNQRVQEAVEFLKGGSVASIQKMTAEMEAAAENLEFERAAALRDRIAAIQRVTEKQKVVSAKIAEQDVIALAQGKGSGADGCVEVFRFREGRLYDREHFLLAETGEPTQARGEFLKRYYSMRDEVPPRISLDGEAADTPLLEEWLSQKAGRKVSIVVPQKGEQFKLTEMCRNNAAEHLAQSSGRTGRETSALDELSRLLGLSKPPMRIESYDISNLAGGENVAGMVVFENGRPKKSDYRKFQIKDIVGQDDYGSMTEVLTRRFREYEKHQAEGDDTGFGALPDLILLDGGKGHVNAIAPVLKQFGLDIPLFGMVKDDKHRTRAITGDGGEISILSHRRAFTLVSDIQEEVHRFAIGYHRQQRKKKTLSSELLQIDGIGQQRATALFQRFRTMDRIRNATVEELADTPSMNQTAAESVYRYFHSEEAADA